MKATSGHLVLADDVDYSDLTSVFLDVLRTFLEETEQMPEDEEVFEMYLFLNMHDLEKNRKPEGFKRKDNMKLVFPLSRKEFYIRNEDEEEASEVVRLTEKMSRILKKASIEHDVEWNQLYLSEEEEE